MSRRTPYSPHEIDIVREHYPWKGAKVCAFILNCSVGKISKIVQSIGLRRTVEQDNFVRSQSHERPDNKQRVPFAQFLKIEKPEVAYLLGYMWADGYVRFTARKVYMFAMLILERDYLVIKKSLDTLGNWRTYRSINCAGNPAISIQTSNIPLVKWLLDMDYGEKSFVAPSKIVNHIPIALRHYFWRGYFDGDGHFRIGGGLYHFSFTADYTYDWTAHSAFLDSLDIDYKISQRTMKRGRKSDIVCSNMAGTYAFGKYIYTNRETDGIGLDRKYNKWLICKKRVEDIQQTKSVQIKQPSTIPLNDDILLEIIKEYSGAINQRTIAKHYNLKGWQVSEMTQRLCRKKMITFTGNRSSVCYVAL